MKIYKFKNYEDYVTAQTEANVRKIKNVWVKEKTIKKILTFMPHANKILCHGTRNGKEQSYFKKYYPNSTVIGTEISHTATKFPMTVQHDFHKEKSEWKQSFDIVYSNSWDHSYDPELSLITWVNQLNENGRLFIEQATSEIDNKARRSDPLEIYHEEILALIEKVSARLINTYDDISGPSGKLPIRMYIIAK